jgi:hypothetical protein
MRPPKNVPVVKTTASAMQLDTVAQYHTSDTRSRLIGKSKRVGRRLDDGEAGRGASMAGQDSGLIQLSISLHTRTVDSGTFGAIENATLNRRGVGAARHEAAQGVDFTHQVALCRCRQLTDCNSSRQWCRVDSSPAPRGRRFDMLHSPLRSRRGRRLRR